MSFTVHIRHDAEIDIEEAAFWYEKQREGLGGEFLDEIQSTLRLMAQNPFMYTVVHRYTRHALIKRFPFGIYLEEDMPGASRYFGQDHGILGEIGSPDEILPCPAAIFMRK